MRSFLVASLIVGCFLATIAQKQRTNLRNVRDTIQNHPECSSIGTPVAVVHCGGQTTCDFPNEVCVAVDDEEKSHSHNIPSETTVAVLKKQQKMVNTAHEANEATNKAPSVEEQTGSDQEATYEATKVSSSIGNSSPHQTKISKEVAHETVPSTRKSKKKKITQEVVSTSQKEENDEEAYGAAPSSVTNDQPKKTIQKVTSQPKKASSQEDIPKPKKQLRTKPATQEATPSPRKIHKPKTTSPKQVASSHKETITNDQESSYGAESATADESQSHTSGRVASKSQKAKTVSHESGATQDEIRPRPAAAREETKSTIIKTSHVVAKAPLLTKKVSHEDDEAEEVKYIRGEGSTADDDSTKIPPLIRDGTQQRSQHPNQATATSARQQQNPSKQSGSQGCPKLCALKQNQHRPYCTRRRCSSAPEQLGYNPRYYAALTNVCGGCINGEYGGICPRACRTKRNEPKKMQASICVPVPPACRKFFAKPIQTQKATPAEPQPRRNLSRTQRPQHQEAQQPIEQQPPSPVSQPHIAPQHQQGYEEQAQQQQQSHVAPEPQAAQPQPQQQPHLAPQIPAAPQPQITPVQPQQHLQVAPPLQQQHGHNQPPVHQESSAKLSVSVLQPAEEQGHQQQQPQPHQQPQVAPQISAVPHPQVAPLQSQQGHEQQQQLQQQPHVVPQAPVAPHPQVAPPLQQQQGYEQQPQLQQQPHEALQHPAAPQPEQEQNPVPSLATFEQHPQQQGHNQPPVHQESSAKLSVSVLQSGQQRGQQQQQSQPHQQSNVAPQISAGLHPQVAPLQSQQGYEQQQPNLAPQAPVAPQPEVAPPLQQQQSHLAPQIPVAPHPQAAPSQSQQGYGQLPQSEQHSQVAPQISAIPHPQVVPSQPQQQGYGQQPQSLQQPHAPLQPQQGQNPVPSLVTFEQHPQQQGQNEPSEHLKASAKFSVSVVQPAEQQSHQQQQQPQKATQVTNQSKVHPKESLLQNQPPQSPNHGESPPSHPLSPSAVSDKVPEQQTPHQQSTEDKHTPIKPKPAPLNPKQVGPGHGKPKSVPVQEEESHSQDSHSTTGSKAAPAGPAASVPEAEPPEKAPETHVAHPIPQPEPEPQSSHSHSQQGGYSAPQSIPVAPGSIEQAPPHGAQVQNGHDGGIVSLPNPQVQRQSLAVSTVSQGSLPGTQQQQAHGSNAPAASSFPSAIVYRKQTGDYHLHCCLWAKLGKCTEDARFMCTVCQHSCGTRGCTDETYRSFTPRPTFDSCPW